jgi:hypothetical protein
MAAPAKSPVKVERHPSERRSVRTVWTGHRYTTNAAVDLVILEYQRCWSGELGRFDLLLQSAKLATETGSSAVWTADRHFQRIGAHFQEV